MAETMRGCCHDIETVPRFYLFRGWHLCIRFSHKEELIGLTKNIKMMLAGGGGGGEVGGVSGVCVKYFAQLW